MELREIKPEERPICQQCGTPLEWCKNSTYYEEIFSWEYACECVDIDRLKPDSTFKFVP